MTADGELNIKYQLSASSEALVTGRVLTDGTAYHHNGRLQY